MALIRVIDPVPDIFSCKCMSGLCNLHKKWPGPDED